MSRTVDCASEQPPAFRQVVHVGKFELHADSAFASGYQSIKLVKSNMSMGEPPTTNFTIECR